MRPGDEFELSRELVLQAVATRHTVPSLGYVVWERRKKLKAEYQGLTRRPDSRHAAVGRRSDRGAADAAVGLHRRHVARRASTLIRRCTRRKS